jgi:hypothetical protein
MRGQAAEVPYCGCSEPRELRLRVEFAVGWGVCRATGAHVPSLAENLYALFLVYFVCLVGNGMECCVVACKIMSRQRQQYVMAMPTAVARSASPSIGRLFRTLIHGHVPAVANGSRWRAQAGRRD